MRSISGSFGTKLRTLRLLGLLAFLDGPRGTTWDDGDLTQISDVTPPLVSELKLNFTGSITLAYYFINGEAGLPPSGIPECRTEDFKISINGLEKTGTIGNFQFGKYVIFEVGGLEGETLIRFEVAFSMEDQCAALGTPDEDFIPGVNNVLSGIFISNCEEGPFITRTLGYWKNHPTVIDGSFDGPDDFPSLLPLNFCGEDIPEPCDAVKFLRSRGGGIKCFKRQGMAALLNCQAFGCPDGIYDLIMAGSEACAAGDGFDFKAACSDLDDYNESGDDFELPFKSPPAQPKLCPKNKKNKKNKKNR
jgi:hypothetical protein